MAHCRDKDTGSGILGTYIGVSPLGGCRFLIKTWPYPAACRLQCWDALGQTTNRAGKQPCHQQIGCLMSSWAHSCLLNTLPYKALPTRGVRPFPFQEVCTSLSDSIIHLEADSRTKNYSPAAHGTQTTIIESPTKMRQQKNISQRKEQDKAPEEQLVKWRGR